jgi:hypothetical protein
MLKKTFKCLIIDKLREAEDCGLLISKDEVIIQD